MSYSNNQAYFNWNLRFCENELKVSDTEGKWCWHPEDLPRHPFENLEKTLALLFLHHKKMPHESTPSIQHLFWNEMAHVHTTESEMNLNYQ